MTGNSGTAAGHAPRHVAIAADLEQKIASGQHAAGSRFPTEKELQAHYEVGRYTIREALKILTERGMIGRRRKTGTVVLSRAPLATYVHSVRDIRSLLDFAHNTILDVRCKAFVTLAKPALHGFREDTGTRWLAIAGVRSSLANGQPLCWSEIYIPEAHAPDRDRIPYNGQAVYEAAMRQHDLRLDHVEQVIEATSLPARVAAFFDVEAHSPALAVRRRYLAHPGRSFEITHNLFPADRYSVESVFRQRI